MEKAWDAVFISGAFVGQKRRFSVAELTHSHWKQVREAARTGSDFDYMTRSSSTARKAVAMDFTTLWCEAIANNNGGEFEAAWDLEGQAAVAEGHATKKRRGLDKHGAAAAEEQAAVAADDIQQSKFLGEEIY